MGSNLKTEDPNDKVVTDKGKHEHNGLSYMVEMSQTLMVNQLVGKRFICSKCGYIIEYKLREVLT